MFITKKKYEEALHKAKLEVANEWERKMCEMEKRIWEDQEKYRMQDDYRRRFDAVEKRILTLEKKAGLVEETKRCPCEVTPNYY